jgi:integrase
MRKMATMKLRYVHSFVDKTGRVRFYFRHKGERWPLPGQPGSMEFAARYDELRRERVEPRRNNVAFGPNTVGSIIEKYIASDAFKTKAHHTRRQYRRLLDRVKEICGRALIADLREEHVREIRSRFLPHTFTADEVVMLLSILWVFAKENLAMRLGQNPATDIRRLHKRSWEHEPWPESVIRKFEAEARPQPNARLALLLLLFTGQRAGDVAAMKWEQYDGKGIEVRQQKTDELLWIPCHSKLRAALDSAERKSDFILTTQFGSGYSAGAFCNMIAEATAQIGSKEYTAHGLRKNAAKALAEADCTVHQIMAITGHRTWKQAMHYTEGAAQKGLAQQAIDKLEGSTKVANPRTFAEPKVANLIEKPRKNGVSR